MLQFVSVLIRGCSFFDNSLFYLVATISLSLPLTHTSLFHTTQPDAKSSNKKRYKSAIFVKQKSTQSIMVRLFSYFEIHTISPTRGQHKCVPLSYIFANKYTQLCKQSSLVQWLWEQTHVTKVVGLNPSTVFWMDIFHLLFAVKIVVFV